MRRTPWPRLLLLAVVAAVLSAGLLRLLEGRGWVLMPPAALSWVVVLLIAAVVLRLGWNVRQFSRGKRPGLDPLVAARTVVLATASAHTGALLAGWYAGHVLVVWRDLAVAPRRDVAVAAGIEVLAALVLAVVGAIVERWCQVEPPSDPPDGVSAGSAA
jgi:hypothetical protein